MDENESMSIDELQPDILLQFLVGGANNSGLEIPLTLSTGGALISGHLCSFKDYMEGFVDLMVGNDPENELRKTAIEFFVPSEEDEKERENLSDKSLKYIHLKNARFYGGNANPIPADQGVWWRGRLSAIDGFNLGGLLVESR